METGCRQSLLDTWSGLLRVRRRVLDAVESDLKERGFPPLAECLAMIHLRDSQHGALRPLDLEKSLDAPQYAVSRIIDRLEKAGFVVRKACPVDGRSHYAVLTESGRGEIAMIWPIYCAAIERHLGAHLCDAGASTLASLLDRVAPPTAP